MADSVLACPPARHHLEPQGGRTVKIALLGGTGRQGKGLALRFALAGHEIWVGSRTQEKADEAVAGMNEILAGRATIQPAANADAASQADIVFLTVPHPHELPTVESLKAELSGKVLRLLHEVPQ